MALAALAISSASLNEEAAANFAISSSSDQSIPCSFIILTQTGQTHGSPLIQSIKNPETG